MSKKPRVVNLAQFRQNKQTTRAADENGWNAQIAEPDWVPKSPVCMYVYDTESQALAGGVINWEDLENCRKETSGVPVESFAAALGNTLETYNKVMKGPDERMWRETLMRAAFLYATRTQSFGIIPAYDKHIHFVVLGYPGKENDYLVRPFAFRCESNGTLLDMDTLASSINRVIHIDKTTHPEWFSGGAAIIPFERKKPTEDSPSP